MLDINALRSIPLLSKLSTEEITALRPRLKPREVRKNVMIMRDGSPGQELMIILNGGVRVFRVGDRAKEITLAHLNAGDFFGEIALLTGSLRTANIIAMSRTALLELSYADFLTHIERFSGLPLALAASLADRLRLASGRIADIALLDVPHRLLRTLEKMAVPMPGSSQLYIPRRPTHQELADMVGSSREVVSRCLKMLEIHSQIKVEGRIIHLLDRSDKD